MKRYHSNGVPKYMYNSKMMVELWKRLSDLYVRIGDFLHEVEACRATDPTFLFGRVKQHAACFDSHVCGNLARAPDPECGGTASKCPEHNQPSQ